MSGRIEPGVIVMARNCIHPENNGAIGEVLSPARRPGYDWEVEFTRLLVWSEGNPFGRRGSVYAYQLVPLTPPPGAKSTTTDADRPQPVEAA